MNENGIAGVRTLGTRMLLSALLTIALFHSALGCAPTVALQAPKEPIVINMNIKVEHEIKMTVDEDLEDLFDEEKEIF